jgi:hypothetical protein
MVHKPQVVHVATASKVALALSPGVDDQNAAACRARYSDDRVLLHVRAPDDER